MLQSLQERILCHLAEFDWREQHDLQREQAALISVPSKPEDSEQKERLSARACPPVQKLLSLGHTGADFFLILTLFNLKF